VRRNVETTDINKYMKLNPWSLFAVGALALAGCSTAKTHVDSGAIHARTFAFINTGTRAVPTYAEKRKQVHAAVQDAITKNLAAKGLSKVDQGGDVIVAYLIIAGNNATTTSLNEYFGYTPDATALVDKAHRSQAMKGDERGYVEAGSLVIDFLDPTTSKVLKRATVQAQILRELPMDERVARLQRLVDQALSDLRVAQ
jgi:hypothetical protein